MSKRKIILLSLIAIFACIYAVQLVLGSKNTVQNVLLEQSITAIRLTTRDGTVSTFHNQVIPASDTTEEQSQWALSDGTRLETFPIQRMKEQLSNIRVLSTVSTDVHADRYALQDGNAVIVEGLNGQEVIRTIKVGKASTTTSQTYAIIDNSNSIVLVSGNLNDIFDKPVEELIAVETETEIN